jgi:hypothetical protein
MSSSAETLPVEHLFTMHLDLDLGHNVVMPNGPHGTRVFAPVNGGTVSGPRINGVVLRGADWVTARSDGFSQLDVRLVIQTDDDCVVAMEYRGILDPGADRRARVAPLFQAAAEQYHWLNHVQAVGIGTPGKNDVTYEIYALR